MKDRLHISGIPFLDLPVTKDTLLLIGKAIKKARIDRDVSQQQLAEKAGYSIAYLSVVECGHRAPTIQFLEKLAIALKMTLRGLLVGARISNKKDEHLEVAIKVVQLFEGIPLQSQAQQLNLFL